MDETRIADLSEKLRMSGKYRDLCDDTLRRIASCAALRHPRQKEALKAAKQKLHQIYGAYAERLDMNAIDASVDSLAGVPPEAVPQVCLEILKRHASAAERIPALAETYQRLWAQTGTPRAVLDLACGLNPFALPWMNLPRTVCYVAIDIDRRLTAAIGRFLAALGQNGEAVCSDALVATPDIDVDMVLLLKALPCLEQQEKGASLRLIRALKSRWTVVSFPTHSLGGRQKGMADHYARFMEGLASELGCDVFTWTVRNEAFYLCGQTPGGPPFGTTKRIP
ncbi:MAG TPA: 16S rRNA methyltransferase [Candidatus Hydrogenedentes bacterium]|nr:16S rRNA methyltransferase [Candidatus Hydrogenedentota bacterium]HPG69103.1 16S rRNA methyltransferase [Candidatus Hydrogenedentota bacterium]